MLAGMFSFMNRNKSGGGDDPNASGVYLDDLNVENMDPEVAALYFPNFHQHRKVKINSLLYKLNIRHSATCVYIFYSVFKN